MSNERLIRGGSCLSSECELRGAFRTGLTADYQLHNIGCRLACAPRSGDVLTMRGGSCWTGESSLRNASRSWGTPDCRYASGGFRLICAPRSPR